MYFITPSNPKVFLIGISDDRLFGFGEKDAKLCIYRKSVFDIGDWEIFYSTDINVMKTECCENGLHVAVGCFESTLWIAAKDDKITRFFSIEMNSKQLTSYKMLEEIYPEFALPDLNLCSSCLLPVIRYRGCFSSLSCFIITPRRYVKDVGIYRIMCNINSSQHCMLWTKAEPFFLNPSASSTIAVNDLGEVFSIVEKSDNDGSIKTVSVSFGNVSHHSDLPLDNDVWHDMIFCSGNHDTLFCLTRQQRPDDILLRFFLVKISFEQSSIHFYNMSNSVVDSNFPSFDCATFCAAFSPMDTNFPTSAIPIMMESTQDVITPCFFVFQTSTSIVTYCRRMLSLSESAYLSLSRIPRLLSPTVRTPEVKLSIFQRIQRFFQRKKEKGFKDNVWMSLDFIKSTLGLSKDFQLH